ncbi:hypothetical protein ACFYNL_14105 [Streptomyces sp. NPDC007808]|uniref:hypothetical protein n=1 Tax=Streptomyces sp. NPDC007808 TaxID=3364779 RepID=UPI0036CB2484
MDSQEHVCPACGQPVETVVKRHKTLGAWVPVWVAGPCRNRKCEAYVEEGAEHGEEQHRKKSGRTAAQTGAAAAAEEAGETAGPPAVKES